MTLVAPKDAVVNRKVTRLRSDASARQASIPQMEFDWEIGHTRPWLKVGEIARSLKSGPVHVYNLIDEGLLDAVIDINPIEGSPNHSYRILRESFHRFLNRAEKPPATDFETVLHGHLKHVSTVMSAWGAAAHLRCSDDTILRLAPHFVDIAVRDRRCLRIHRQALLNFILSRRVA